MNKPEEEMPWFCRLKNSIEKLKNYHPNDAQNEETDAIISECPAKIATYLT